MMLSVDKMTILVGIFSRANYVSDYLGRYLGDWDEIFPAKSARSCPETGAVAEFTPGDTPKLIRKDISLKTNKTKYFPWLWMTFTLTNSYWQQVLETSTLCAPKILIVWIKYLFLKVNDYIMMIGHKQIRLGLISRKIMHNYPRAYQRNCDKGEVRPHRCHWEGMSEKHLSLMSRHKHVMLTVWWHMDDARWRENVQLKLTFSFDLAHWWVVYYVTLFLFVLWEA